MQSIYAYKNKFVRISIYDFMRINLYDIMRKFDVRSIRIHYGQHLRMLRKLPKSLVWDMVDSLFIEY